MARWVPTLPASKSGRICDTNVSAKRAMEPWKESRWQGGSEPQWQESKRSIRERAWKEHVEFTEGGKQVAVWMAAQEIDDDTMALWCEWFSNHMQLETGKEAEVVLAIEVDFSKNRLTAVGVRDLLAVLSKHGVAVQVLKLYANRIEADAGFARWIVGSRGSLRGLHLSRNKLDTESATSIALAILDAHGADGTPCYPVRQQTRGVAAVPFWLRIEWNHVDPVVFNERIEAAFRASRRLGKAFCNADYGCSPWTCSRHPGCPAVMHAWYLASQGKPLETVEPAVFPEPFVGDLDVARAAKLAARPGKSGPRKQANPTPIPGKSRLDEATAVSITEPPTASSGHCGQKVATIHEEAVCQSDKWTSTKALGDYFGRPISLKRSGKAEHQAAELTPESITEPMPEPLSGDTLAEERSPEPSAEPAIEPTAEPFSGRSRWRPVKKVAEPVTEPITEPVAEPVAEPVLAQVTEPALNIQVAEPEEELAVRAAVRIELLVHRINQGLLKHALRLCGPALQAMAAEGKRAKKALDEQALVDKIAEEALLRREKEEAEIADAIVNALKRTAQSLEEASSEHTTAVSSFEPSGSSSMSLLSSETTACLQPCILQPRPGTTDAGQHAKPSTLPPSEQTFASMPKGKRANKMRHHIPMPKAQVPSLPAPGDLLKAAVRSEAMASSDPDVTRHVRPFALSNVAAEGPKPAGRVTETRTEADARLVAAERRQALLKRYGAMHSDVAGVMSL